MDNPATRDLSASRTAAATQQRWIAVLFLAVVAAMCVLVAGATFALNAARAYVGGEGLWAKSQKRAVHHLLRHAETLDARDFAAYQRDIAVPFADRRAREALIATPPDYDAAYQALLEGHNHPDDAGAMVAIVRHFGGIDDLQRAMALWTRADAWVVELDQVAHRLRDATSQPVVDRARVGVLVGKILRVDDELTAHENEFSATVGATARRVARAVPIIACASGAALLALVIVLAQRLLRRVRRSEAQRAKFLEHASDVFALVDAQGSMSFIAPSVRGTLGYEPSELIGRPAFDLIHSEDVRSVAERLAVAFAHPGEPQSAEFRFRHRDGSYRIMEAIGTAHVDDGEVEVIVTSRDVTERRMLEQELLRAQKMESIGRLAGGIAHDFNNVLTALIGHAEQARADLQGAPAIRAELDEIVHGAERAAALTRQLLAFARRQVIAPKVIDLGSLLLGLREMLRRLLGNAISLSIEIDPELGPVRADPGQIEQIVVNLAVNARDAMPDGGRVEIALANLVVEGAAPARRALRPGDYVVLSVSDSGVGFDEETARHLFEPFFTTKPDGAGTGLGLATCYGIATQSGGDIWVSSRPGAGARFDVLLPRASEAARPDAIAPSAEELPRGSETVLVVEDEEAVRRVTVRSLRAWGYRVFEAADGEAALALPALREGAVDLIVSDVMMPRLGGVALAEELERQSSRTRVLLVSGYTNDARLEAGMRLAALPFLHKPFTRDELARAVRNALDSCASGARSEA
jgi:PAS domain S-box-containing protein